MTPHLAAAAILATAGHRTTADTITGLFAFAVTAVIVVGLIVYVTRWRQVRGATSRADALNRAFGDGAAKGVMIGSFAVAGVFLVLAVIVTTTGR